VIRRGLPSVAAMTIPLTRRTLAGTLMLTLAPSAMLLAGTPSAATAAATTPAHAAAASTRFASLQAVAVAPHSKTAFALGTHGSAKGTSFYALRRKSTHWSTLKVANPASTSLSGIAAGSKSKAWIVGSRFTTTEQPLIESLKGSRFKVSKTKLPGGELLAVAASSAKNAWAVGGTDNGGGLAARWNGKKWKSVPISQPVSQLTAVSTTSAKNVWALTSSDGLPASAHWNGHTWKITPIAGVGPSLRGIAASSAKSAWAVGSIFVPKGTSGSTRAVAYHFTGKKWKKVSAASPEAQTFLVAVAAHGKHAYAVGQGSGKKNFLESRPVVLRLSHGKFKAMRVSKRGQASSLAAVSMSSKAATAVGQWAVHPPCQTNSTPPKPFIVSPHGSSWGEVSAPEATALAQRRC
jgi:hypothetical protein